MNLPTYRMMIDENDATTGVDFISLVKDPAIEEIFIAFSESKLYFEVQKEKRILYGPLMIPEKRIYRNDTRLGEYYVYFTSSDIESVVRKFSKNNYNNNISLEHLGLVVKGTLMENFIIREGMSIKGFEDLPVGTWMGAVYIEDLEFWENFVKSDIVRGFSIEINGLLRKEDFSIEQIWSELLDIISSDITDESIEKVEDLFKKYKFESYDDYPKAASEAAARALSLRNKHNLKCGTLVGWQRANQLAKGENISRETIGRMAAFERHRENSKGDPKEDCGALMWLAWGGDEGIAWAQRKLKQIDAALNSSAYQTIVNKMSEDEFIVEPREGETKDEYIGRCIGIEVDVGYSQDQAAAICISKWENK